MTKYTWEVEVKIKDEKGEIIDTLGGWELSDTTFYGINDDVEQYINDTYEVTQ
jgi:hypothetical protein